jgi:cell pole-organizing protein PopZ
MQHPLYNEEVFMEEALAAIRGAMSDDEAGGEKPTHAGPRTSGEEARPQPMSRETTVAIGSAFNRLSETAKKHEPTLEDVVREMLRPMLRS